MSDQDQVDIAVSYVRKVLTSKVGISSVSRRGGSVLIKADFATMPTFNLIRISNAASYVFRTWPGVGMALIPIGATTIFGLPDIPSPHLVPGAPPGGVGL